MELAPDADSLEHGSQRRPRRDRSSRLTNEVRTEHGHPSARHSVREPQNQRMQPRHLVDDDDRRPGAAPKHRPRPPTERIGEVEADISVQRAVIGHAPFPPRRLLDPCARRGLRGFIDDTRGRA
jgi:hypothetical protein